MTRPGALERRYDFSPHGKIYAAGGTRVEYRLDDQDLAESLWSRVPPLAADLIDFGLAVYLVDRLELPSARYEMGRLLHLKLGLRWHDRWQGEVSVRAGELLKWLSGDTWCLEIVPYRGPGRISENQGWLLSSQMPAAVRLFSGGLDSLAGAATALTQNDAKPTLLVSGAANSHQLSGQRAQAERLRANSRSYVQHLAVRYGLRGGNRIRQNRWRRTRGLLHLALGCAAALAAGLPELSLAENGWGALNLPYDDAQLGVDMSRAVHPATLLGLSRLIATISGAPFGIRNEGIYRTKAEMLTAMPVEVRGTIAQTFSCDRFRLRNAAGAQCGRCTSCLLRHQSLAAAGLSDFDRADYLEMPKLGDSAARPIFWQAHRLRQCLGAPDPWTALARQFPEMRRAAAAQAELDASDAGTVTARWMRMLHQHVREWEHAAPAPLGAAA